MIIGFAGKAGSGKTTAARHLLDNPHLSIRILAMAAMLREEVEAFLRRVGADQQVPLLYGDQQDKVRIFTVDSQQAQAACPRWPEFLHHNEDIQTSQADTAVSVRRLLQWWGTEYRRAQDADYWTKAWERKLASFAAAGGEPYDVLVDDVRFTNELEMLKKHDAFIIRIVRPGFDGANDHSSENSLDAYADWDLIVHNDGDLDQFLSAIDAALLPRLASHAAS